MLAETPFSAIPQIQLEPRVSRSEAAVQKRLVRMVPGSARNWIAVKTIPSQQKNENKKYDNSKLNKINWQLAFAALCSFHRNDVGVVYAVADGASRKPGTGW